MKDQKLKKQDEERGGVNPIVAAVAGAVVGAGIAVAGVALSDEKNRKKVKIGVDKAKELTIEYMEGVQKKVQDKKHEEEKKIEKIVSKAKSSLHKASNDVNKAVQTI